MLDRDPRLKNGGYSGLRCVLTSPKEIFAARWNGYPVSTKRYVSEKDVASFCEGCDNQGTNNVCVLEPKYGTVELSQATQVLKGECESAVLNGVSGKMIKEKKSK